MKKVLRIDLETYSSVDIKKAGAYKYVASPDFEILIMCYAIDDDSKIVIDLAGALENIPTDVIDMLTDPMVTKKAYNANFERLALGKHLGYPMPPEQWECTAVKGSRHGLPGNLDQLAKALDEVELKDAKGKALIKYFSVPCKPTKANGMRTRNLPFHDWEKWEQYKAYCKQDVETEHQVDEVLALNKLTGSESQLWAVDQIINDRGVAIDNELVKQALAFDDRYSNELEDEVRKITGIDNPNSVQQLQKWLSDTCSIGMKSLAKDYVIDKLERIKIYLSLFESGSIEDIYIEYLGGIPLSLWDTALPNTVKPNTLEELKYFLSEGIIQEEDLRNIPARFKLGEAIRVLELRLELAKSSIKKYKAIEDAAVRQEGSTRVHGLLQFYGANRTGRWAGRLVQVQNLARNYMPNLHEARELVRSGDYDTLTMLFGSVSSVLSQLIRTAFVATSDQHILRICDYSAIEARVLAWLSNEKWRLEVFAGDGKIYEASAVRMFNIPIETIAKGQPNYKYRASGKVAELALGYGGGAAAIEIMDSKGDIPEEDRLPIRDKWRAANPAIVKFWKQVGDACMNAIRTGNIIELQYGLQFYTMDEYLFIVLPSGRKLAYYGAHIEEEGGKFGQDEVRYYGINDKKQWVLIGSYGPKFVENIVQAVSRDCLAVALMRLHHEGFNPVMHIHDEIVCDELIDGANTLERMSEIMAKPIPWAPNLLLPAEGYESEYYKKED